MSMLLSVETSPGHHRCARRPVPVRSRPHLRRLTGLDQPAHGPLPRRGRGRVRATVAAPADQPECDPGSDGRLDRRAAQAASPRPGSTPAPTRSAGTCSHHHHTHRCPGPPSTGSWSAPARDPATRRNAPSPPTSDSRPSSPTRPGSPTSPTTGSLGPTALPAPTSRSSPGSTTTPATPCTLSAHARITAPIVLTTFRQAADHPRLPGLHPDRQRHGLHRPLRRRPRRTHHARDRTPPARTSCRRTPARTTPPPAARSNGSSRR